MWAHILSAIDDPGADRALEAAARLQPTEVKVMRALRLARRGNLDAAVAQMGMAMKAWRTDPWPRQGFMQGALQHRYFLSIYDETDG